MLSDVCLTVFEHDFYNTSVIDMRFKISVESGRRDKFTTHVINNLIES